MPWVPADEEELAICGDICELVDGMRLGKVIRLLAGFLLCLAVEYENDHDPTKAKQQLVDVFERLAKDWHLVATKQ